MNPDYEQQLEVRIDRELKGLPELQAPPAIHARVMAAIAVRNALPVPSGPRVLPARARFALFFALCAVAFVVCYGLFLAKGGDTFANVAQAFATFYGILSLLGGAVQIILSAIGIALKNLGTPVIAGVIAAAALSYLTCVALGTVCYRFAFGSVTRSS